MSATCAADVGRWRSVRLPCPWAINLVFISRQRETPRLVIPDAWPDELAARIASQWSGLALPVVRHGQWAADASGAADGAAAPAIAFGAPAENPLVADVLQRRGMRFEHAGLKAPALLALQQPERVGASWVLAVAVDRPEVAAGIPLELVVRLTCSWALLDGQHVVQADHIVTG